MSWKTLSTVAIILAIAMGLGFGYDQPLVGLISLALLLVVGVYALNRASQEEKPRKGKRKR